ncbi:serine dehydratase alpha chain-domain-containing protein [Thelonectria olida]|uniref:Serine dehydratase alpha chain-domain-containing protein n=1 Tax=Thelonectria olida TaxID=1576542 RepID=A0A9P9AK74_9HYPO|nr:serine dehydratase alpha chain-domain-containing protein [Thelonectria olida]
MVGMLLRKRLNLPHGLVNGSYHRVASGHLHVNGFKTLSRRPSAPRRAGGITGGQLTATKTQSPLDFRIRQLRRLSSETEGNDDDPTGTYSEADHEHAVISTFDLFSIGIGPSSSHTVGPMRAGNIFVSDLIEAQILPKVHKIRVSVYGSLALTGEGHMTPSALLLGLEGMDVETVDTAYVPSRFTDIKKKKKLFLGNGLPQGGGKEIDFDYDRDFVWEWGRKLPLHSNGMRFSVFDKDGIILATNDMFSVGGGFVVNGALSIVTISPSPEDQLASDDSGEDAVTHLQTDSSSSGKHPADLAENLFYKEIRRSDAAGDRRTGSEVKSHEGDGSSTLPSVVSEGGSTAAVGSNTEEAEGTAPHQPRYPFRDAASLLRICHQHNLTIAQVVYENEKSHGYTDDEIFTKLFRIWEVMDNSILEGVQAPLNSILPGSLKLHRRAPALYKRLTRGLYPSHSQTSAAGGDSNKSQSLLAEGGAESAPISSTQVTTWQKTARSASMMQRARQPPRVHGSLVHPIAPSPTRRTTLPAMDYLTVYAMAVNETNAAGGRIVTAPTNGAAGIIPAVLKYVVEFLSDDPERDIPTFLLTAAAFGMLFKRGATISAAEGGCMAEVGVACAMASGAFAACMGAAPETIEQSAEIGIEHNLGLTCDPIGGLVQAPCIERNALGAIKAVSSANLALSSEVGTQKVRLDDAIRAMRLTAKGMRNEFKETSLSGLATSVPLNIPVSVPDC